MARLQGDLNFMPIVQPYVGAPIEEFSKTLDTLQNRYDENLSTFNKLDIMAKNTLVPDTLDSVKQQALEKLRNTMFETVQSGRYEDADAIIGQAAREFATDQNLNAAQRVYQNIKKMEEVERKIKSTPGNFGVFKPFDLSDPTNYIDEETGKVKEFDPSLLIEARGNRDATRETLVNDLKPNSYEIDITRNKDFQHLLQMGTVRAITDKRVKQYVEDVYGRYVDGTADGNQEFREYKASGLTDEQAKEKIIENLLATARERVFIDVDTKYMNDDIAIANYKAGLDAKVNRGIYTSTAGEAIDIPLNFEPLTSKQSINSNVTRLRILNDKIEKETNPNEILRLQEQKQSLTQSIEREQSKLDVYSNYIARDVYDRAEQLIFGTSKVGKKGSIPNDKYKAFKKLFPTENDFTEYAKNTYNLSQNYTDEEFNQNKAFDLQAIVDYAKNKKLDLTESELYTAAAVVGRVATDYEQNVDSYNDNLKIATDYNKYQGLDEGVVEGRNIVGVDRVNNAVTAAWKGGGNWINPKTKDQVNENYLAKVFGTEDDKIELKVAGGDNIDTYRDPSKDKMVITDGAIDGRLFYELQTYDKEGRHLGSVVISPGDDNLTKGNSRVIPHNLEVVREIRLIATTGAQLEEANQLEANTIYLPTIAAAKVYEAPLTTIKVQDRTGIPYDVKVEKRDQGKLAVTQINGKDVDDPYELEGQAQLARYLHRLLYEETE